MLFICDPYLFGKKVRIVKTRVGSLGAVGLEGVIVDKPSNRGMLPSFKENFPDAVCVQTDPNNVWLLGRPHEIELEPLDTPARGV